MLRLLSLILLLAGAAVAAVGGWLYMGNDVPAGLLGTSETVVERKVLPPKEAPAAPAPASPAPAPVVAAAPPPPPPSAPEPVEVADVEAFEAIEPVVIETAPSDVKKSGTMRTRSLSTSAPAETPEEIPVQPVMERAAAPQPEAMANAEEELVFGTETMSMEEILAIEPAAGPAPEPPTIEEQLFTVPIAYETPNNATFGQSFKVTLSINAQDGATTATGGLSGSGTVVQDTAQVTDRVEAALNGDAFKIELKSPKRLKLSRSTESLWRWEVTPIKSGPHDLTFDLFAIDANNEAEMVRTFNDTVTVEVSRIGQAVFLAQQYDPIIMMIAGLGSLLAGLFGAARFFRGG